MAHIRIDVDLAFPVDDDGNMTLEVKAVHDALIMALQAAKPLATDIVAPTGAVESACRARKHICRHADGKPCELVEDIVSAKPKGEVIR